MQVGDLVRDTHDGEFGLVVGLGRGYHIHGSRLPSYLIKWQKSAGEQLIEIGSDAIKAGLIEVVCKAEVK